MNKWEYLFVSPKEEWVQSHQYTDIQCPTEEDFNELGEQAWELASCKINDEGEVILAIFKRKGKSLN